MNGNGVAMLSCRTTNFQTKHNFSKAIFNCLCYKLLLAMAKTNDYGGQGLNRGNSMHFKKQLDEGVVYGDKVKKWLVRIKKNGTICSMAAYTNKIDAEKHYATLCNG